MFRWTVPQQARAHPVIQLLSGKRRRGAKFRSPGLIVLRPNTTDSTHPANLTPDDSSHRAHAASLPLGLATRNGLAIVPSGSHRTSPRARTGPWSDNTARRCLPRSLLDDTV